MVEYCPEETVPYYSFVNIFLKFLSVKDEGKERMIAAPLEAKIAGNKKMQIFEFKS